MAQRQVVAGNYEDKYNTTNPVARRLVDGFIAAFRRALEDGEHPRRIGEFGAGEGYLTRILAARFPASVIDASDLSRDILQLAKKNLEGGAVTLSVQDVENLPYREDSFDLIVCCEVLEHVSRPEKALAEINRVAKDRVVFSVPREPLWRILNCLRGKYLASLGNTPGHVNHWSKWGFVDLLRRHGFRVLEVSSPLPWTMVLAQKEPSAP
jgi:ubiquinone/menaquinone biosynthesis C-methylase UbiE